MWIIPVLCYVFAFLYAAQAAFLSVRALKSRDRFSFEMLSEWGSASILTLVSYGFLVLGGIDPANRLLAVLLVFAFVCAAISYYICEREPTFIVE